MQLTLKSLYAQKPLTFQGKIKIFGAKSPVYPIKNLDFDFPSRKAYRDLIGQKNPQLAAIFWNSQHHRLNFELNNGSKSDFSVDSTIPMTRYAIPESNGTHRRQVIVRWRYWHDMLTELEIREEGK